MAAAVLKRKRNAAGDTPSNKKRQRSEDTDPSYANDNAQDPLDAPMDLDEEGVEEEDEEEDVGSEEDEEDEWNGLGDSGADASISGPSGGGGKPKKPPTGEEVRAIKEATDLYKSNTFKLRIDALLPTIRPKQSRTAPLERFLLELHTFLSSLPSVAPQLPHEAARSVAIPSSSSTFASTLKVTKGKSKSKARKSTEQGNATNVAEAITVAVPFPLPMPPADAAYKLAFEPPSNILLTGSWATKTGVKAKDMKPWTVDVALEMPADLFQEKDYLNGRFFHKRAYYLAVIARHIVDSASSSKKDRLNVDVYYESTNGDPRHTTLILRPRADGSPTDFTSLNAQVRLFPFLPATNPMSTILSRLAPTRSNLRITPNPSPTSAVDATVTAHLPTPLYNSALLLSYTPKVHLLKNHELSKEVSGFMDGIALLRVWANQRGYDGGASSPVKTTKNDGSGTGVENDAMCVLGFAGRGAWWAALVQGIASGFDVVRVDKDGKVKGGKGGGAFGGKGRAMGRGLSSYQLFKAALDFLARWDVQKEMVLVKGGSAHRFQPEEYTIHLPTGPVFVDSSSYVNLLAGVPLSSLEMLKHDAKVTLHALDNGSAHNDSFPEVFLKDHRDLVSRFDAVIRVDLSAVKVRRPSLHSTLEHGSHSAALLSSISSYLHRALGRRIRALAILTPSSESPTQLRDLSAAQPISPTTLTIGLIFNTEHAFRLVDHGPALTSTDDSITDANTQEKTPAQKEIDDFRDFWGDKSELRRFKDGRIVESVVWEIKTADDKAHISTRIVRHILSLHFGITESSHIQTWQSDFDSILRLPESVSTTYSAMGMTAGSKAVSAALDDLVKVLKGMDDQLVLSVLNVSPISEYLRHTSAFVPIALPPAALVANPGKVKECMSYVPTVEVVVEFEKSARWPDELRAIQKMKLAFFETMANGIMGNVKGSVAKVIVGDGPGPSNGGTEGGIVDEARLEVVLKEGWCFVFRIWHDREALLLDRIIHDREPPALKKLQGPEDEAEKARLVREATEAREVYTRRFVHAPRHHRAVMALCHRFSAYPGTVRLVKRWLAAHWLLRGHISEEAVEILCASVFLGVGSPSAKEADDVPGSRERGFARVVRLLMEWEWETGPLEVSIYEEGTEAGDKGVLGKGVTKGVWRLKTAFDVDGKMWTAHEPDLVSALRVRQIAKATWDRLRAMESGTLDVKALFVHPTDDYDFIVQLDPAVLPRYFQNVAADPNIWGHKGRYANLTIQNDVKRPLRPGFDPVQMFVDDLKRVYEHTLKIFHDPLGGDRIGAVWEPKLKEAHPFKVMSHFSSRPVPKGGEKAKNSNHWEVVVNEAGVLTEIARMGAGLVLNE